MTFFSFLYCLPFLYKRKTQVVKRGQLCFCCFFLCMCVLFYTQNLYFTFNKLLLPKAFACLVSKKVVWEIYQRYKLGSCKILQSYCNVVCWLFFRRSQTTYNIKKSIFNKAYANSMSVPVNICICCKLDVIALLSLYNSNI